MSNKPGPMTPEYLLDELIAAFRVEPVPTADELVEHGSESEWCRAQVSPFVGRRWTGLSPEFLTANGWIGCFSPVAYRYYLPALLRAALITFASTNSQRFARPSLTHNAISELELRGPDLLVHPNFARKLRCFREFSESQSAVVRSFLALCFDRVHAGRLAILRPGVSDR